MIASPPEYNARYAHLTDGEPEPFVNGAGPTPELEARGPGEYYANVTYLDAEIGRVLDYLDEEGLADDTLVFFASDNGPVTTDWRHWWEINLYGSTGGLRGRKADLWDGGIRVPAIVRWPGRVAPNTVSDAVLSGYDLLPTLAAIAGFEVPGDRPIDGENFGPVLEGNAWARQRPLYWEFDDDQGFHFALRSGRHKLLIDEEMSRVELYDLVTDPFEVVEISAIEPQTVERLLTELDQIRRSVDTDPLRPAATLEQKCFRGD